MIRPTRPDDVPELIALTDATGRFKPLEIIALREVLDDYFAEAHPSGHRAVTLEREGAIDGFAYYAPASMTDRTWHLWWIAVRRDRQGAGLGGTLLKHVEDDIRQQQGRLIFIETGSVPKYEATRLFYKKHGYEEHAMLKDFYARDDSQVIFRKALE
jgi:ribosomal protein S18 acetylase RimI-like enzyme